MVYIWTYILTGICLVGSFSNSVERVLSYFEKKQYFFLDFRKGVQFLADYGFENIQLTLIYLDNQKFTMRDIKILEAYYINELKSKLYGYFTFSTKILEGSDLDNLLSLNELIKLKDSINPKNLVEVTQLY